MFKLFKSFFEVGPSNGHHLSSYLPLDPDKDSSIDTGQATVKFGTESNDSNMMNFDYSGESLTMFSSKIKKFKGCNWATLLSICMVHVHFLLSEN